MLQCKRNKGCTNTSKEQKTSKGKTQLCINRTTRVITTNSVKQSHAYTQQQHADSLCLEYVWPDAYGKSKPETHLLSTPSNKLIRTHTHAHTGTHAHTHKHKLATYKLKSNAIWSFPSTHTHTRLHPSVQLRLKEYKQRGRSQRDQRIVSMVTAIPSVE